MGGKYLREKFEWGYIHDVICLRNNKIQCIKTWERFRGTRHEGKCGKGGGVRYNLRAQRWQADGQSSVVVLRRRVNGGVSVRLL